MSRIASRTLVAVVAGTLLGCSVSHPPWRTVPLDPSARFVHPSAGAVFPVQIAKFRRGEVRAYDGDGHDISVTYALATPGKTVLATLYVYPTGYADPAADSLQQHFARVQADLRQVHPDALLIEEQKVETSHNGEVTAGYLSAFTFTESFAGLVQPVRSSIYLFSRGPWFVKYRMTYPESQRATVESDVRAFVSSLDWDESPNAPLPSMPRSKAANTVDVNQRLEHGWTLLMQAALDGNAPAVEALIARGANVNAQTEKGETPLLIAVLNGHTDVARVLIFQGADVNAATSSGMTPLMLATIRRDEQMVQLLKNAGARTGFEAEPGPPKYPGQLPADVLRK